MKHIDEPEKFMESELELHAEINELYAIAASPELYPTFVEAGSVNSLLGTNEIFCVWFSYHICGDKKYKEVYVMKFSRLLLSSFLLPIPLHLAIFYFHTLLPFFGFEPLHL